MLLMKSYHRQHSTRMNQKGFGLGLVSHSLQIDGLAWDLLLTLCNDSAPGLILREVYINDPATDTAWTNALVFSMIMDLLPHIRIGNIQASESESWGSAFMRSDSRCASRQMSESWRL
jgi:hypothetical protein